MSRNDMPARIWVTHEKSFWEEGYRTFGACDLDYGDECPEYVRADLVREAMEALRQLTERRKGIEADILSAHSNRGNGASEWMREDDRDFRRDLRRAFEAADAAIEKLKEVGL